MKKIFLSVFALIIALFLFQPGFVHAEEVNLFNVSNISQYTSIIPGMEFTTGFIYTDTSLPDGYYEITISSGLISTTPDDYHSVFISNDNEDFFINQALAKNYDSGTEVFSYVFYVADGTFQIDFLDSSGDTVFAQDPQYVTSMNFGIYSFDLSVPVFSYSSLTYDTSYADPITLAEVQADLSVFDPIDGDITSSITVYQDDYTESAMTIGETYSIVFSVENSEHYQSYITVDITVVDDVAPIFYRFNVPVSLITFEGVEYPTLVVQLPFNFTESDFETAIEGLRFMDDSHFNAVFSDHELFDSENSRYSLSLCTVIGGQFFDYSDLNNSLEYLSDNYYYFDFGGQVSDEFDNFLYFQIIFEVAEPDLQFKVNDVVTDYEGILSFTVDVNESDFSFQYLYDILKDVEIYNGSEWVFLYDVDTGYSGMLDIIDIDSFYLLNHVYFLEETLDISEYFVSLLSGVSGLMNFYFNIVDDIDPVFESSTPNRIVVPSIVVFDLSDITLLISVSDNRDSVGDLTLQIESDTFTGNENVVGRYVVVYYLEDLQGNSSTHSVVVWVVNVTAPIVTVFNNNLVTVSINTPMDEADIIAMLDSYGIVVTELSYDVTILEDNYTGHESVPGVYTMILQLDFSDDSQEIITLSFEVVSTNLVPDVETEILSLLLVGFGSGSILLIIGFAIYLKNKKKHRFN